MLTQSHKVQWCTQDVDSHGHNILYGGAKFLRTKVAKKSWENIIL